MRAGRSPNDGQPKVLATRLLSSVLHRPARFVRRRRAWQAFVRETGGQSTVEYAFVLLAFLAMVLALGAVWATAREGGLQRLARLAASHAIEGEGLLGGMRDIVLF